MCLDVEPRCTKNLISQRTQRNLYAESPAQKWMSCPKVDIGTPSLKTKNKDPKHQTCEIWISNANIGNPLISLHKLELRPWAGLSVQLCLASKPRGVVCELVGLPFPPPQSPHVAFLRCLCAHLEAEFGHAWETHMKTLAVMYDGHMPSLCKWQTGSNNEITSCDMPCGFWKQKVGMHWKNYWNSKLFDLLPTMGALWLHEVNPREGDFS